MPGLPTERQNHCSTDDSYGLSRGSTPVLLRPGRISHSTHEVALSVKYLRDRAQQWHIDTDKILVMGFSAGGHLAASYGVFWQEEHMAEAAGCSKKSSGLRG